MHCAACLPPRPAPAQLNSDQSAFQRRFTKEIARISEVDRRVAQMEAMLIANEVPYIKMEDAPLEEKEASADVLDRIEVRTCCNVYFLAACISIRLFLCLPPPICVAFVV